MPFVSKKVYKQFCVFFFSKKELISSVNNKSIICCSEISCFYKITHLFIFFKKILAIHKYKQSSNLLLFFKDYLYIKTLTTSLKKYPINYFKDALHIKVTTGFVVFNSILNYPFRIIYTLKQWKWVCIGYVNPRFCMFPFDYKILINYHSFFCIYFFNIFFIRYVIKR